MFYLCSSNHGGDAGKVHTILQLGSGELPAWPENAETYLPSSCSPPHLIPPPSKQPQGDRSGQQHAQRQGLPGPGFWSGEGGRGQQLAPQESRSPGIQRALPTMCPQGSPSLSPIGSISHAPHCSHRKDPQASWLKFMAQPHVFSAGGALSLRQSPFHCAVAMVWSLPQADGCVS